MTTQSASARVLPQLAMDAKLMRGRPRGTWSNGQYRWVPTADWLGGPVEELDQASAQAELVRRWLAAFGPATETDLRWWTGWTAREVRAALAAVPHETVDLDGATGLVLAGDVEPVEPPEPWAALLSTLDPTTMGWKERDWYLGPHASVLFDVNGNAGPTVWWDGRVVGGWSQRRDGEIVYRLLEDVGADAVAAIEAEVARVDGLDRRRPLLTRVPAAVPARARLLAPRDHELQLRRVAGIALDRVHDLHDHDRRGDACVLELGGDRGTYPLRQVDRRGGPQRDARAHAAVRLVHELVLAHVDERRERRAHPERMHLHLAAARAGEHEDVAAAPVHARDPGERAAARVGPGPRGRARRRARSGSAAARG